MNKTRQQLINKLEGDPTGDQTPSPRLLKYLPKLDVFEELTPAHQSNLNRGLHPDKKTLLLIHGTFSTTTPWVIKEDPSKLLEEIQVATPENEHKGSFGEFVERTQVNTPAGIQKTGPSFLKSWMEETKKYQQVLAYDHHTVIEGIEENVNTLIDLLEQLGGENFEFTQPVDIITGSRGGLVGQHLANTYKVDGQTNTKISIGNAVVIASPNRGSGLLTFPELLPPSKRKKNGDFYTRKTYKKALKRFISNIKSIPWGWRVAIKLYLSFQGEFIEFLLSRPGIVDQTPESKFLKAFEQAHPSPNNLSRTQYLPIVGEYEGLAKELKFIGPELEQLIDLILERYDKFRIKILFSFKVKRLLSKKRARKILKNILEKDIKTAVKGDLFKNKDNDLVISTENSYTFPEGHRTRSFPSPDYRTQSSVAVHSYYLDEFFRPFVFGEETRIKQVIRDWLEGAGGGESVFW